MKQHHWIILSTGIGLLSTLGFVVVKSRKQKRNASRFLRKLTVLLNPKTTGLLAEKAFDIHYYKNLVGKVNGRLLVIKNDAASQATQKIKSNWGYFYTSDEDVQKINAVLKSLPDKAAVSKTSEIYLKITGVNLIDEFQSRLSEKQIQSILTTVKNLKPFQIKV